MSPTDLLPTIKAAAVQAEPIILDRDATIDKACHLIGEAAANGAKLIVFPELFVPTFINAAVWGQGSAKFWTSNVKHAWLRLWQNAVTIPGPATERLSNAARDANAVVVMGMHEREESGKTLYNTLLFINSDGALLGKHRKLTPTHTERLFHGRGDGSSIRVYDTPVGRIGGLICWENWMPLSRFALYSQGEQIHLAPTADSGDQWLVNVRNTAFEGGVFVISVSMILRKQNFPVDFPFSRELADMDEYIMDGGSAIIDPEGTVLAGPLYREESILYADLDLNRVVEQSQALDTTGHYSRPDIFRLQVNRAPQQLVEKHD